MDSDEGEGESINEGQWREGSLYTFSNRGCVYGKAQHVSSLLSAGAHSRGGAEEKREGVSCGGSKVQGE